MDNKKACKVISRITPDQAFHLLRRTRSESKTQSELIRELIDQDKIQRDKETTKVSGLSLKSIHQKNRMASKK